MSYEVATRFTMNHKQYTITCHPNNVSPAAHCTETKPTDYENMTALFNNLVFGNLQPVPSCTRLYYAINRALSETSEKYGIDDLSWWIWKNRIYLAGSPIYNPVEQDCFSRFITYLMEENRKEKYCIVWDDRFYCKPGKGLTFRYQYEKYEMDYMKAYSFYLNLQKTSHKDHVKLIQA